MKLKNKSRIHTVNLQLKEIFESVSYKFDSKEVNIKVEYGLPKDNTNLLFDLIEVGHEHLKYHIIFVYDKDQFLFLSLLEKLLNKIEENKMLHSFVKITRKEKEITATFSIIVDLIKE